MDDYANIFEILDAIKESEDSLLEAQNLDIRKNKIAEILKTYTHDIYQNNTIQ